MKTFFTSQFLALDPSLIGGFLSFIDEWGGFAYSVWFFILWMIFFIEWTDYYLDFWVITNRRIVDAEQIGFFRRQVVSLGYEQIQDITVETKGFIRTIFNFGTLHIQTAGERNDIVISDAHFPEDARSLILKLQEQSKAR